MINPLIKVAYADDHVLVRKGIIGLINSEEINVTIEADNGKELIQKLEKAKEIPDVCLLDINMKVMNGFDTIIVLKRKWPEMKVLALTVFDKEIYIIRMIRYGASGYLLKNCDPEDIKRAVTVVYNNGTYYSEIMTRQFFNAVQYGQIKLQEFTAKEKQLLEYCPSDLSYEEIAQKMQVSERAVAGYRDSLFKKLNIHSRPSLAMFAIQFGIVPENTHIFRDKFFNYIK